MPCRSDYMYPNALEMEASRISLMLDEVTYNKPVDTETRFWDGYHPEFYKTDLTIETVNELTASLCFALSATEDVTVFSLEVQTWWREHQKSDALRIENEKDQKMIEHLRKSGLSKLTNDEKFALGLIK